VKQTSKYLFEFNSSRVETAALIGKEEVFAVVVDCFGYEEKPSYIAFQVTLHQVPGCRLDRSQCSLLYDPFRDCVYIFGGQKISTRSPQTSRASEVFLPATLSLEQLPDMLEPRAAFGACWHLNCVYLCGGSHPSIETFNPQTETFSMMCDLRERLEGVAAFSYRGYLYLLGKSEIWKRGRLVWEKVVRKTRNGSDVKRRASNSAAVLGTSCYFLCESRSATLDLRTLTETYHHIVLSQ